MPMSRMNSPAVAMDDDGIAGHALSDFLLHLENYNPSIPDSVVAHYLNMSGFESQDPRWVRHLKHVCTVNTQHVQYWIF